MERVDQINYSIKKLPLIGSILKLQRPEKIDLVSMIRIIDTYRVFQTIVEPKNESQAKILVSNGFYLSKNPYLPTKTLQIDLTQSKEKILSHFKKDARRAIKKTAFAMSRVHHSVGGEPRGDSGFIKEYSTPSDIRRWRKAWRDSVNFSRFVPNERVLLNLRRSFPQNKSLFLASHNISGSVIGGALFTISSHERSNHISYYWYGFTNSEGRTSLSQYSLLWNGILWAKKQGCKIFDFEGIYDSRFPNKSWLGFSHFKKSFGGVEVLYPGCYVRFRLPI